MIIQIINLSLPYFRFTHKAPFVVYADFEAFLNPTGDTYGRRGHKTIEYEEQTPCSIGWKVVSVIPQFDKPFQHRMGEDCVLQFLNEMRDFAEEAVEFLWDEARMIISEDQQAEFEQSTICHICNKFINPGDEKNQKVRDHDHVTGEYIGPAHNQCNLQAKQTYKIPIFFHNFRGYDGHFITKALNHFGKEKIQVIGQGMEKYLTLSLGHLIFKDSLQFLPASLQTLAANLLKAGVDNFKCLKKQCEEANDYQIQLLLRKGVYPYEYMDSAEKLKETQLPPKYAFYSRLHDADITDEEYAHAKEVWRSFQMTTMEDYHNLYLLSMSSFLPISYCLCHNH